MVIVPVSVTSSGTLSGGAGLSLPAVTVGLTSERRALKMLAESTGANSLRASLASAACSCC